MPDKNSKQKKTQDTNEHAAEAHEQAGLAGRVSDGPDEGELGVLPHVRVVQRVRGDGRDLHPRGELVDEARPLVIDEAEHLFHGEHPV